jgi:hypothetical protein
LNPVHNFHSVSLRFWGYVWQFPRRSVMDMCWHVWVLICVSIPLWNCLFGNTIKLY